jgi:hypothetical protein
LDRLRREELTSLGPRIRARLVTELASSEELLSCLDRLLKSSANVTLMTKGLRHVLVDHASGNFRIFVSMAESCS